MISYDIDPSLHTGEPAPQLLDDGFSPPHHADAGEGSDSHVPAPAARQSEDAPMLSEKSAF
ncbi:MAG: hypothetical protein JWQ07_250 [Ramlibacter sp.]|nr:hypothetical protein [Ramlibacter sp.]